MAPSTANPAVLLVDDEEHILYSASLMLRSMGITDIITQNDSRKALSVIADNHIGVVVLDLCMPGVNGQELLQEISFRHPEIPIIVMTAVDDLDTAVCCMKNGAYDYIVKPVEKDRLVSSVRRAQEAYSLRSEVTTLRKRLISGEIEEGSAFSHIITRNRTMIGIFRYIEAIAGTEQPVLITGETGVGKELFAKAIHLASKRKGEFVAVNAAGLDDSAFSDTLFGHRRGAFTGADREREGLVARAGGGTLFLDEIGDLEMKSQVRLLRLLQEREYYPLGSDVPKKSTARIVVATNSRLEDLVGTGTFRNDLYYRLRSHHITIPPLRERKDDVALLTSRFIAESASELGKAVPTIPPELMTLLTTYSFPGNVRELQALVFDALARHTRGVLSLKTFRSVIDTAGKDVSADTAPVGSSESSSGKLPTLKEAEESLVAEALRISDNNQGIAASLLGITRQALNKRLNRKKN